MSPDLTELILDTNYDAFKNNNIYTGTFTISGTTSAGVNAQTDTITLDAIPDITDIVFNGPAYGSSDPRPDNGWFHSGAIEVLGNNVPAGYVNYPTLWLPYSSIDGTTVTITCYYAQQFIDALTLTSTEVSYRIIDYSVF